MRKIRYLNVIKELSWGDFKLKYYGSFFGLFWSFLKPLFMLSILYLVFFFFLKVDIENYVWFLLLGIIFWNFFADATKDSMQNMVAKAHILKNVNIPPFVIIVSSLLHSFWTFMIGLLAFFILFFVFGFYPGESIILFPYFIILLMLLTAGISFIVVPLSVRFKDFNHMWDIFLQMLFWITPIAYQHFIVPEAYMKWYLLNPIARVIIEARTTVIYSTFPEGKQIFITTLIVLCIFIVGFTLFKKMSRSLVEQL